jgi:hypothetical protein
MPLIGGYGAPRGGLFSPGERPIVAEQRYWNSIQRSQSLKTVPVGADVDRKRAVRIPSYLSVPFLRDPDPSLDMIESRHGYAYARRVACRYSYGICK